MDETTKGEGEEGTGEGIVTGVDLAREATDLQRVVVMMMIVMYDYWCYRSLPRRLDA